MTQSDSTQPHPVLFFDHIISSSNPYNLAVFSHWFPSPFHSPALPLPSPSTTSSSADTSSPSRSSSSRLVPEDSSSSGLLLFKTAEHWMMYHKALLFHPPSCDAILSASTPEQARDLGREIPNFDRDTWGKHADKVVEEGNYRKFSILHYSEQHENQEEEDRRRKEMEESKKRQEALFGTQGRRLVECNPNDRIWGIGFSVDEAMDHQAEWGQNRMGNALGRARDRLMIEVGKDAAV